MASPELSQNLVPENPQLADLLDLVKKDIMLSLVCHHIGTVQSFDAAKQTATATINYKKTFFDRDAQTGLYQKRYVDYPVLLDCPVVVLGGGAAALTMPVAKGDECLVLFNDRDIDNWFQSGQVGPVATSRLHSFSDALILVGVRSMNKVIEDYDAAKAVLRYGAAMVAVGEKIKIANADASLKDVLDDLVSAVNDLNDAFVNNAANLVLVTGAPGNPSPMNPAIVTLLGAVTTALSQVGTKLGELLE